MILRINGAAVTEPELWKGPLTRVIENGASNLFFGKLADLFASLNAFSPEIITLGVVTCAIGMMVGPLVGNGKWLGRLFITFWFGIIWRVLT
ncbi:hypothetical protein PASE110613_09005 [Paenibacillus sediminis]|uniref:ABC transmembrane type-1 domain-containing protein n=1 Tax=Paenibacillus sediminis TaxID=664909 RepID=A0ABS4H6V1_9BACL|nr:hypothetical protein [Paenibacillus sediminis]MBP1938216.1 hypothetical protein [Paenibacillus sediminis]